MPGQRPLPSIKMCTPRDQHERRATLAAGVRTAVGGPKAGIKEGYTREAYVTEMLRSAAAADAQTIAAALIAVINSLPSGGERVQLYRAVQDVQSAVDACVDKYTLRNSEGDPVVYKPLKDAAEGLARHICTLCLRVNICCAGSLALTGNHLYRLCAWSVPLGRTGRTITHLGGATCGDSGPAPRPMHLSRD